MKIKSTKSNIMTINFLNFLKSTLIFRDFIPSKMLVKQFCYTKYYLYLIMYIKISCTDFVIPNTTYLKQFCQFYYLYFLHILLYFYTLNEVEEKQRNKNIHVKYTRFRPQVFPKYLDGCRIGFRLALKTGNFFVVSNLQVKML